MNPKHLISSCVIACSALSFAADAGTSTQSIGDHIAESTNTTLSAMQSLLYGSHQLTHTLSDQDTQQARAQIEKALGLAPSSDWTAPADISTFQNTLLSTQISGFDAPVSSPSTQIDIKSLAQCALSNIALPLSAQNNNRVADAQACYVRISNNSTTPSTLNTVLTQLNSQCKQTPDTSITTSENNPCDNVRQISKLQLYLNYCTTSPQSATPSTPPTQASSDSNSPINVGSDALQPCSDTAALKLYKDMGTWWSTYKTTAQLSQTNRSHLDEIFSKTSNTGEAAKQAAKTQLKLLKAPFDQIEQSIKNQYVQSVMTQTQSSSQQPATPLSGIESLLNLDRLTTRETQGACFANQAQQVALNRSPLDSVTSMIKRFSQRYPAPEQLYPTVPFDAQGNLVVVAAPDGSVGLHSIKQLANTTANNKYWKNTEKKGPAQTSLKQREQQLASIQQLQDQYRTMADKFSVSRNAGFSNLTYLMNLRLPSEAFKSNSCTGNQTAASPQEWMKASAMMRQNTDWTDAMKQANMGNAMRQAVLLLSEMRTQMYLDNQLQQRVLLALTLLQLNASVKNNGSTQQLKRNLETQISKYVTGDFGAPTAASTPLPANTPIPSIPTSS